MKVIYSLKDRSLCVFSYDTKKISIGITMPTQEVHIEDLDWCSSSMFVAGPSILTYQPYVDELHGYAKTLKSISGSRGPCLLKIDHRNRYIG